MPIKIALPKGRLLPDTAVLVRQSGWQLSDYTEGTRLYHLASASFPDLTGKIFHEKDIPIQVAMGNYDMGICGLDWIQELVVKYPGSGLVKVADLGYGAATLNLAASPGSRLSSLKAIQSRREVISIASEYPNLAESMALNCHFRRFNVFPVWRAAEIYPPENADLVLIARSEQELFEAGLIKVARILDSSAYLVANKTSWENKDLSSLLKTIGFNSMPSPVVAAQPAVPGLRVNHSGDLSRMSTANRESRNPETPCHLNGEMVQSPVFSDNKLAQDIPADSIRLALPDGHTQKHAVNILNKAGIKINDYPSHSGNRKPRIELEGTTVKVVRPQDMPLQVANGKFDLAITGKDWVKEHLYKFPSSPITELLDLKYSSVKIVAAISGDLPVSDIAGLRQLSIEKGWRLRVASEYVSIADKYARDNHLGMYRVIPTWGATEAFVPDDADLLIENTETGSTLKRHNLKIIETLFESTACLIANTGSLNSAKAGRIKSFAATLRKAVEES